MARDGTRRGGARSGAGRKPGNHTKLSPSAVERMRARIQTNSIIQHLNQIALGERGAEPYVITAGLGLLKKVVPDRKEVEMTGKDGGAIQHEVGLTWMTQEEAKARGWV